MIKLGSHVKVSEESIWYDDVGESIGIVAAIPHDLNEYSCRIVFPKESFLEAYSILHSCSTPSYFDVDMEYFNKVEGYNGGFSFILKNKYKGYEIKFNELIEVKIKKGNTSVFGR